MALTYCIVKMFQQQSRDRLTRRNVQRALEEGSNTYDVNTLKGSTNKTCRVCLKEGIVPIIPKSKSLYTIKALQTITSIDVSEHDEFPKFLCKTCHSLLRGAMLLRTLAQKSDDILRNITSKLETNSDIADADSSGEDNEEDVKPFDVKPEPEDPLSNGVVTRRNIQRSSTAPKNSTSKMTQLGLKKKKEKIQCRICSKEVNKYYYKDHLVRHGVGAKKAKVMTKCSTCNKPLEKAYLRQHMASVHGMTQKQFVCFVCGKTYKYQGGYNCHILTHTNDFPFKCHLCPYRGRHSGLLKVHMRIHTREFKYQCTDCPARFLTNGNLHKHMQRHQEPTFRCETCNKGFFSKPKMERHFQVDHLGIKNHICNICDKAFGYRSAMMKHQIKVHKRAKMPKGRNAAYLLAERKDQDSE